jgi:hypothetical protein
MRNAILGAAMIVGAFHSVPAFAAPEKDWSQMGLQERLAWAAGYMKQVCGTTAASEADKARSGSIANAPQWAVKMYISANCPARTAQVKR